MYRTILSLLLTVAIQLLALSSSNASDLLCFKIHGQNQPRFITPHEVRNDTLAIEQFRNREVLLQILRSQGLLDSNSNPESTNTISGLNQLVRKLLQKENVKFIERDGYFEILATLDGARINRYLHRLKSLYKVNPGFFLKIDLKPIGGFDRETRDIYFGVETLAYFVAKNAERNLNGVVPHELLHAVSRQFLFDQSTSEIEEINPRSLYAFSIEEASLAGGYTKSIDIAEIGAQLISARYSLSQILKRIRAGVEDKDANYAFLKNFFTGIAFNLKEIQDSHIDDYYRRLNMTQGTKFESRLGQRDVAILDAADIQSDSKDPTSDAYLREIGQKANYKGYTKIVLVADRSLKNSSVFIFDSHRPTYVTKAPSHLDKSQLLDWVKAHFDHKHALIEKARIIISDATRELNKPLSAASSNAISEALMKSLSLLTSLIKEQWHPVRSANKPVLEAADVNGVVGLEMDLDIGTATHIGNGLFISAAHNLVGRTDRFNPKKYYFDKTSITSFDRTENLTGTHYGQQISRYLLKSTTQYYSKSLRVLKTAVPVPDIAFFKARAAQSNGGPQLGSYSIKKTSYAGGALVTIVTGLQGPRVLTAKFERMEPISEANRLLVVSTEEPLGPGDSGSPLFEINSETGAMEIVGILHGAGATSGQAYFVEVYSALKNILSASGAPEEALAASNEVEVWN